VCAVSCGPPIGHDGCRELLSFPAAPAAGSAAAVRRDAGNCGLCRCHRRITRHPSNVACLRQCRRPCERIVTHAFQFAPVATGPEEEWFFTCFTPTQVHVAPHEADDTGSRALAPFTGNRARYLSVFCC